MKRCVTLTRGLGRGLLAASGAWLKEYVEKK